MVAESKAKAAVQVPYALLHPQHGSYMLTFRSNVLARHPILQLLGKPRAFLPEHLQAPGGVPSFRSRCQSITQSLLPLHAELR